MKIIYVLGLGRSGSTLITSLLNLHPDVVGVGEVNRILMRGGNSICSCGITLDSCVFWSKVFSTINSKLGISREEIAEIVFNQESKRNFFNPFVRERERERERERDASLNRVFYQAVVNASGRNVIVDSSKNIMRYFSIRGHFDITTITVIRNPFGVCWSLAKKYKNNKSKNSILIYSLLSYTFNNLFILLLSLFDRKMIVFKYESIPVITKSKWFWGKLGLTEKYDLKKVLHIGYGNDLIYSFNPNEYVFKEDIEYKSKLKWYWKLMVYIITWPILVLKGYKF